VVQRGSSIDVGLAVGLLAAPALSVEGVMLAS
jgi:hypothetical protein